MTEYTTTSLIKELEKFPKDLPIETELATLFNYDSDKVLEECSEKEFDSEEDMFDVYKKYATEVAIFEGSWEEDNISDLNNILPKYIIGWEPEHHCNNNAILKEDIITKFFQIVMEIVDIGLNDDGTITISRYEDYKILFDFMKLLGLSESIEDILCKIEAQKKYSKEEKLLLFAPEDGLCYYCGKQIYNRISMEKAKNELITHCPYCSRSYND